MSGPADELRSVEAAFDDLVAGVDHPMVVVTTASGGERAGCLVGFHSQCGISPPRYAVWLSKANHTYRVGAMAETFAVHLLRADHRRLGVLFGSVTDDEGDKFARCAWSEGPDGVPLLDEVPDRVVGRRLALLDAGADHVCVVLAPVEVTGSGTGPWLAYSALRDVEAGHGAEERQHPR